MTAGTLQTAGRICALAQPLINKPTLCLIICPYSIVALLPAHTHGGADVRAHVLDDNDIPAFCELCL